MSDAERRLLLVHAHPDDESIVTGGVMAKYAAEGAQVTLVTCTRGEEGEIVPADLRHLGTGRLLAAVREGELAEAMRRLGVTDHRFLGPYEDSGMAGTPENDRPTAFWNADLDEAAERLAAILRETQPQVVVTYDEHGGYGHPDHIQAHRVTALAVAAAAPDAKRYHVVWGPPDRRERELKDYENAGRPGGFDTPPHEPSSHPAPRITTAIDVSAHLDRKLAALDAHRTQLTITGRFFALSNNVMHEVLDTEWFSLAHGSAEVPPETETDLFAGVTW